MVHPILKTKERLGLYLVAALLAGAVLAFGIAGPDLDRLKDALVLTVPLALLYSFVCLAARYPCQANPVPSTAVSRVLGVQLAAAVLSSSIWLGAAVAWFTALERAGIVGSRELFSSRTPMFFATGVMLYLLAAAVHYLLLAFEASLRAESRALELKVLAREAELEAFKTQIDPHFIFNCLNSISSLCGSDPPAARRASIRLGDFLRASLKLAANDRIPLAEELRLVSAYLDVERVRYGDRLAYEQDVEPACLEQAVPALLLQPLLENALKHGIAQLVGGGTVRLTGAIAGGQMSLRIENPCDPDTEGTQGAGIGLANVRGRLKLLYDGRASLEAHRADESYRVDIRLPLEPVAA